MFDSPPIDPADDLRPEFFGGAEWYRSLREQTNETFAVWRLAKDQENAWWVQLLNAALAFAKEHGLTQEYSRRFAGIAPNHVTISRATLERRSPNSPIWEIANELVVGRYLERVLGWLYQQHEPIGRGDRRGEWEFQIAGDRRVFVEVKTFTEPEMPSTGAYTRPDYRGRVRSVLRGAYQQLPQDRATLVVLVGSELTRVPFGIMHGDIFQSLFGQMQVRFTVLPVYDPASTRLEPSWRDMFVQQAKHRRLGAIAGLSVRGLEEPALTFYAIDNPWSHAEVRLPPESLTRCWRFVVDENGRGEELRGTPAQEAWRLMSVDAATEDNTQGEP